MADCKNPWWVIGSAAVALYLGRDIGVRDVDILLEPGDAKAIRERLGISFAAAKPHPLFRSREYFTSNASPLPIEFMADFSMFSDGRWEAVTLTTRRRMQIGSIVLYTPDIGELVLLLGRFGRPKDLERLALLEAGSFSV